jgi:hypothetical protein
MLRLNIVHLDIDQNGPSLFEQMEADSSFFQPFFSTIAFFATNANDGTIEQYRSMPSIVETTPNSFRLGSVRGWTDALRDTEVYGMRCFSHCHCRERTRDWRRPPMPLPGRPPPLGAKVAWMAAV